MLGSCKVNSDSRHDTGELTYLMKQTSFFATRMITLGLVLMPGIWWWQPTFLYLWNDLDGGRSCAYYCHSFIPEVRQF